MELARELLAVVLCVAAASTVAPAARADDLPKSTQKMLKDLRLVGDPLVADLDREVQSISPSIVEAAKKEGGINYSGSIAPKDFDKMTAPFRERYPFIKIKYSSGDQNARN